MTIQGEEWEQIVRSWRYFMSLESDFLATTRYVEFTEDHYKVYSVEYDRLLRLACSEIETVCKLLCEQIGKPITARKDSNIDGYRKRLTDKFPSLPNAKVLLPAYNLELLPWSGWQQSLSPEWWRDHNDVKHHRAEYYHKGNLGNSVNALAGLFAILLTLSFYIDENLIPSSLSTFIYDRIPHYLTDSGRTPTWVIPKDQQKATDK
jgi:hypothetical protein